MNVIVQGLAFGDEGKGATVDFLCRYLNADLVIRWCGGSQAGHNVVLPDGRSHTFSQWGSGTFYGVPTYLDAGVVIWPEAMEREANHLIENGVRNPWGMLTINAKCLVTTWAARHANRAKELRRRDRKHGSCGHGIGETIGYSEWSDDCLTVSDLRYEDVTTEKLKLQREHFKLSTDGIEIEAATMCRLAVKWNSVDDLPQYQTGVWEGAQGLLLDERYGFFPHVTRGNVTPQRARELCGVDCFVIGVVRSYFTRHGAGPFPTERQNGFCDSRNPFNPHQGDMRFGDFDFDLFAKSLELCRCDGIAVTCLDHHRESLNPIREKCLVVIEANGETYRDRYCRTLFESRRV